MSSTADIVRQLLIDLGLGVDSVSNDWSVFVSFLPDVPDNALCVYDTAGTLDGRIMATGERIVHPGIQIRVRGPLYSEVYSKAQEIALKLDKVQGTDVALSSSESYSVQNVSRSGALLYIGVEQEGDKRRHHFTINAIITKVKG